LSATSATFGRPAGDPRRQAEPARQASGSEAAR